MKTHLILGPAGTGKTTYLLNLMEVELKTGIQPEEIGFVAFTKKAADEAKFRARKMFGFSLARMPYIRTIHSLCFKEINAKMSMMLSKDDFKEISYATGFNTTGYINPEEGAKPESGDFLLSLINLSRARMEPLERTWSKEGEGIEYIKLKYFNDTYEKYKSESGKLDFTDQIYHYLEYGEPTDCKVVIVDEGQDLSKAQWAVIHKAFKHVERLYIAGDDDQAIYKWSGADIDYFLSIKGETIILDKSYRIPKQVYNLSQKIVSRIRHRYEKPFRPKTEKGEVKFVNSIDEVVINKGETYFILVRNKLFFEPIRMYLQQHNILYSIKDKSICNAEEVKLILDWGKQENVEPWYNMLTSIPEFKRNQYRLLMHNGYTLTEKPKVNVSTIHGVKGGEADHVILYTDMLYRSFDTYMHHPDEEHRVFYVAVTRAKKSLTVVSPQSSMFYRIDSG